MCVNQRGSRAGHPRKRKRDRAVRKRPVQQTQRSGRNTFPKHGHSPDRILIGALRLSERTGHRQSLVSTTLPQHIQASLPPVQPSLHHLREITPAGACGGGAASAVAFNGCAAIGYGSTGLDSARRHMLMYLLPFGYVQFMSVIMILLPLLRTTTVCYPAGPTRQRLGLLSH